MTQRVGSAPRALQVDGVSKTFLEQRALRDVSLSVEAGEVRALLGHNGSGKSTLIKILSGFHVPDPGGSISVGGHDLEFGSAKRSYERGCRFVHQDLGLSGSLSVADNIALAGGFPTRGATIRATAMVQRTKTSLAAVGVDLDPRKRVNELSPAMKTAVAIARALGTGSEEDHPTLLVLDEPSATMTGDEVEVLVGIVRAVAARLVGVLYVTHRLEEVFKVADSVSILRDGRLVDSPPLRELDRAALTSLMVGSRVERQEAELADSRSVAAGQAVLRLKGLSSGDLSAFSLTVRAGEIVGIAGIDGSGRESLLPAIFGGALRRGGTVMVRDRVIAAKPRAAVAAGMAFLPADRRRHGGFFSLSARENIALGSESAFWRRGLLRKSSQRRIAQQWFERLQVHPVDDVELELSKYSGGNQQKILLAKWLRLEPSVLLVEEPTQGVDVSAKVDLHAAILSAANNGAAVVVSSSDMDELSAICDRVVVLADGQVSAEVSGAALTPSILAHELMYANPEISE
jgi:ribose transport system ATP-binding protein